MVTAESVGTNQHGASGCAERRGRKKQTVQLHVLSGVLNSWHGTGEENACRFTEFNVAPSDHERLTFEIPPTPEPHVCPVHL
jgi:hypothetical protein